MNDLDDRLTDLFCRSAAAVEVHPDLGAVTDDDGHGGAVVDVRDRPRRTRRVLALAATLLVVVAVVGAVALVADDDEPLGVTDAPLTAEDRFPVFGPLPAALQDRPVEADDGEGSHQNAMISNFLPDTPLVSAAIGQVDDDGSVADVIALVAGAEGMEDRDGPAKGVIEDLGGGYQMVPLTGNPGWVELLGPVSPSGPVSGSLVVRVLVVGGPHVTALVREIAGTGLTATVGPDGRPVLTLRDLPDGYTVTAPPTPPEDLKAEIAIDSEPVVDGGPPAPYVLVETGAGEPSLAVAGGSYRPINVGDSPGYIAVGPSTTVVAWTAPNGVDLRLLTDLGEDDTLLIARGLRLVDEATWRATYPDLDGTPIEDRPAPSTDDETEADPGAPRSAVVPDLVGLTTDDAFARLRAAGFTGAPALVTSRYRADASVPAGIVTAQAVAPGDAIDRGSAVPIDVSAGGPIVPLDQLPAAARAHSGELAGFDELEPILLVATSDGDTYKTDDWLFGPCAAVELASRSFADPEYGESCY